MYVLHNNVYNYYINTILMSTTILYDIHTKMRVNIQLKYCI